MIHVQPGKVSVSVVQSLSLFNSLKDDEQQSIAGHAEKVSFDSRDRIITEGDPGDYFYVILSGQVQVVREDENGEQKVLNYLSAGQFFGEESLLTRRPRNASVEGVKEGELLRFSAQSFQIFQTDPQLAQILERIREVDYTRSMVSTVSFSGQTPGELCLAVERRHTYALAEINHRADSDGSRGEPRPGFSGAPKLLRYGRRVADQRALGCCADRMDVVADRGLVERSVHCDPQTSD